VAARTPIRMSFVGRQGAGKTTAAWIAQRLLSGSVVLSVAQPLYELAGVATRLAGRAPTARQHQDGLLLQHARGLLLQLNPHLLQQTFEREMTLLADTSVMNDDCRLALEPTLRALSFTFVWVSGDHLSRRRDITLPAVTRSPHDTLVAESDCEVHLDNTGSLEDLVVRVRELLHGHG
jgi:hypothetical protein